MSSNRLEKLLNFIEQEPDDPFLKYALATEYLAVNDTEKALVYFEDLVENNKNYVGTYYHLGKLYEALQRKGDAIRIYQEGMKVARDTHDNHAFAELQSVYNSAVGLDYEDD